MELVLIDTKSLKVRIEMLMTGTKIKACHQIMADFERVRIGKCSLLFFLFSDFLI